MSTSKWSTLMSAQETEDQEVERHRRRTAPTHGHIALVCPTDDDGTGLEEACKGGRGTLCLARITTVAYKPGLLHKEHRN